MYVVLKVQNLYSSLAQSVEHAAVNRSVVGSSPTGGVMAQWLSWLERRPVTAEVESSSLFWVVYCDECASYFHCFTNENMMRIFIA